MEFEKTIILKDGRTCLLCSGREEDGEALLFAFQATHGETDFLLSYPDESTHTVEEERRYLKSLSESENGIEILAFMDGNAVASAGIHCVRDREKTRHRAEFGVSVLKEYWGLGIGRALLEACVDCAKKAGYVQLELEVVAENTRAVELYTRAGFVEYGRNPKGFRSRYSGWQEIILMRKEL